MFLDACKRNREHRGWSQRELTRQLERFGLHLAQSSIAKLERSEDESRRPLSLAEAIVLSRALGVSLAPFVRERPDEAETQLVERLANDNAVLWFYLQTVFGKVEDVAEVVSVLRDKIDRDVVAGILMGQASDPEGGDDGERR